MQPLCPLHTFHTLRTLHTLFPAALGLVLAIGLSGTVRADITDLSVEQIKAALHTATPEEDGFVSRTVTLVKAGTLPLDLFESCFVWARHKPRHQFQYFKQALIVRAAAVGITVQ